MTEKFQFTLAGLFVLVLGSALVAGVLWLGAGGPQAAHFLYLTYLTESVYGLSKDSAVTYRGVNVGRVRSIKLDADDSERAQLLLEIRADTPIREDTVATLETQMLTGLAHINLEGGAVALPALQAKPGERYPVIPSRVSPLVRWDEDVSRLLAGLAGIAERLGQLLADPELADIVHELKLTLSNSRDASVHLRSLLEQLDRDAAARVPSLLDKLEASAASVQQMANQIASTGRALEQVVRDRNGDIEQFTAQVLPEAGLLITDLREAAESLRRFSEELERQPALLLRGAPSPRLGPGE
jgi:phospholipid/cholesterol/gamma-HCH transport system substrate-binding protein